MKNYTTVLALATFLLLSLHAQGQIASTHRFESITARPDGAISLLIEGRASASFNLYFDLFPLEASSNLVDWSPLVTMTRTNASTNAFSYLDRKAVSLTSRFYRTVTNWLITPLPPLTGPYPVGTLSRLLTDPSRTNALRRTNHQFMVTFWYPAISPAGALPGPYVDQQLIGGLTGFPGSPIASNFVGHSLANAPLATQQAAYPVVLYSPSVYAHRRENVYKVEELASHGFIVVGLDHRDTFASVFPDGTVVRGPTFSPTMALILEGIKERATDQQFVMDELSRMNSGDPVFAGRLDLERMGAFGFSAGGATAAEVCRTDPRCKAGINMDGMFFVSNLVQTALSTPFMMLRADNGEVQLPDGPPDDRRLVIEKMTHDGYFVRTSGTVHYSFSDLPLVADKSSFQSNFGSPIHPLIPGVRINQIATAYVLSFFRKYLKDEDDHLLDSLPAEFPEVIEFFKK
ncbi:MAG: alpha/beta hydrolase family protein [Verrucomicrobiia bacterium]